MKGLNSLVLFAAVVAVIGIPSHVRAAGNSQITTNNVTAGFDMIAIPLVQGGNEASNVLQTAMPYTKVFQWDEDQLLYNVATKGARGGWSPANLILDAGRAVFIDSPAAQQIIFTDPPLPESEVILDPNVYYLRCPLYYGTATYEDVIGAAPNNKTAFLRYVGDGTAIEPLAPPLWDVYLYEDGTWTPTIPILEPGEGAFIIHPFLEIDLSITGQPPELVLEWPRGSLESTGNPNGEWTNVVGAASPHNIPLFPLSSTSEFYRVRE